MEYAHDAEDWVYGAEGNQTLVLRYKGNDRAYQGHVLRLSKQEQRSLTSPVDVQTQHPQFCVDFIHHVIGPLIGPEYIVPQSIIHVSRPFLQAVSEKIEHERPKSRRGRGIDVDQGWAFVARDLTYGCSIAVEIKVIRRRHCMLSMIIDILLDHVNILAEMGLLKHNRTDFTYCPLDLFSGDPERMEMAIIALEHESAIHGVFKIFHGNQNISQQLRVAVIKQVLLQEPLLARLQSLQRRLDMLDIEGIYPIYIKHQSEGTLPPIDTIQPWVEAVNAIETRTCKSDWQRLYEFALSMVFKDCSVFISIIDLQGQRDRNASRYVSDNSYPRMVKIKGHGGNEKVFGYDIKLVDVDMKKMFKIPLWYDRDQAIVTHAIRMGHPKTCEQVILSSD
ncbi:inositol-pentakisphosphate 2-kinase [Dichotomocladium elegans]|nr:inositol-pentakisphosphate 2-kinase [Dichotomocladium elegans]